MTELNKGTRLTNYAIDSSIITIAASFFEVVFQSSIHHFVFYVPIYLSYYILLESITGQTIGKMATKTIVVNRMNQKPSTHQIVFRTLLRLNPFDTYSYLFGKEQGGHDLISKTRLIVKKVTQS